MSHESPGARTLLRQLIKSAKPDKVKPQHKWQKHLKLMGNGISDVSAWGFTVQLGDGIKKVYYDQGWTEEHYDWFEEHLVDQKKAMIAEGVLKNMLRLAGCEEWNTTAWWLFEKQRGNNKKAWLRQLVQADGFAAIANNIQQALLDYRKVTPRPEPGHTANTTNLGTLAKKLDKITDLMIATIKQKPEANQQLATKVPAWCHAATDRPPADSYFGPFSGTQVEIARWILPNTPDPRNLRPRAKNGKIWVCKNSGKEYEVWFRSQSEWATANSRRLNDIQNQQAAAQN